MYNRVPVNLRNDAHLNIPERAHHGNGARTHLWNEIEDKQEENKIKSNPFIISWWNGGGAIRRRLKTNIFLRNYLKSNCDIFAYGEALASNQRGLFLPGYFSIIHYSKPRREKGCRRGIAIFCLEKYKQRISKVYASNKFVIIWLSLPTKNETG